MKVGFWKCLLGFGFALLAALPCTAQLSQPARFEQEVKFNKEGFSIINLNANGLALIRDDNNFEDGKKVLEVVLLDTMLHKDWDGKLLLESRLNLIGYEALSERLFLLFRTGETNTSDLHLLELSLRSHDYHTVEIKHQVDFRLTHFSMTETEALFGGYISREPAVMIYTLADKQLKVVPGFFLKDAELLDLRVNRNQTFNVVLAQRNREENNLVVRTFDGTGALLLEDIIKVDPGKNLLTGITSTLMNDNLLVAGTFTHGSNKSAAGFYSTTVNPFVDQHITYTYLVELRHFVDYTGEKRSNKLKSQADKQRQKGKTPSFRSNVALVRLQESSNGFVLLAEGFQASSSFNSNPYWQYPYNYNYGFGPTYWPYGYYPRGRYYSSPYTNTGAQNNADVRMHNTLLLLFNREGQPLWDETLNLDELRLDALQQTGDFITDGDAFTMAYKQEGKIYAKKVYPDERPAVLDTMDVKLVHDLDVLKDERKDDGGVRHWYGEHFYAWGYQSIRNDSNTTDPVRNVFYINKVGIAH